MPPRPGSARPAWTRHWPILPLVALALALRLVNLFPTFLFGDDAIYATVGETLAQDGFNLAYPDIEDRGPSPFVSQPPLILYLFADATVLFGNAEVGAVAVSVLLGTATVALVYAAGVCLQGRATGALAALFLAVLPFHITMSRKAFLEAGETFFITLTFLAFLLWTQRRTASWAVATGLAAAAACLSKLSGVLILPVLLVGWLAAVVQARGDPTRRNEALAHGGLAALPIAAGGLLYVGLLWFLGSTLDLAEKLGVQFARAAGTAPGPPVENERPWHWYFTDDGFGVLAQVGIVLGVLAAVGVVVLFLNRRRAPVPMPVILVLTLWPLEFLAFFTLSAQKQWFYIVPLAPAVALLAAYPAGLFLARYRLASLGVNVGRPVGGRPVALTKTTASFVAAAILITGLPAADPAYASVEDFVLHDKTFGYGLREAAQWIHARDPDAAQAGTILGRYTLYFYNGQTTYHWYVPREVLDEEARAARLRFVVVDDYLEGSADHDWLIELAERHNGTVEARFSPYSDRTMVRVYELHP